jgi:predicted small secreted protein
MAKRTIRGLRLGLALGFLTGLLLSGCATSRGFGQDVQSLGRNIEKSAK